MTVLLTTLLVAFADPPKVVEAPGKDVKKPEPAKKADAKKDEANKDEPKKEGPSLFKKKKSAPTKEKPDDDAGLTPEGPTPTKTEDKAKEKLKLTDADKDLVRSLGGELAGEEDDPLMRAAKRMRTVEEQLARLQVEQETVVTQEKIVADLREIIERAKKRQQQQQQRKQQQQKEEKNQKETQEEVQERMRRQQQRQQQQQGNQAAQKDGGRRNAKEMLDKSKEERDVWGHLPQMERELMQQTFKEEKLPEFRTQLEKYYSKIAEMSAEKDK